VERLSPSFHCPWLSVVAVLVVVGSIPLGGDYFLFLKICCFGGPTGVRLGIWVHPKKAIVGYIPKGPQNYTQTPKIALLALQTTRFEIAPRALGGAFLGVRADSSRRT
jgi:hypothetical protein